MSLFSSMLSVIFYLWQLLLSWLYLFYVPFTDFNTLWTIIPIWLSWFFVEFFEEKQGTSYGNAISNGVVPFWVGIDWLHQITDNVIMQKLSLTFVVLAKYAISVFVVIYGAVIVVFGIKAKKFIRYLGRIREATYILLIGTPVIYGLVQPDLNYLISVLVFFPIFYFLIEMINFYTPTPKTIEKHSSKSELNFPKF